MKYAVIDIHYGFNILIVFIIHMLLAGAFQELEVS